MLDSYVACPFRDRENGDRKVQDERARIASEWTQVLWLKYKLDVFCPIAHTISVGYDYGATMREVMKFDLKILQICRRLQVVCLAGWEDSKGVKIELDRAVRWNKEVMLVDVDMLERAGIIVPDAMKPSAIGELARKMGMKDGEEPESEEKEDEWDWDWE